MAVNFIVTERLLHSLKTAIACSAAFLLGSIIGLPGDQWVVISVIVVMCAQIYVGGILQKSYLRLLGTLMGCLTAAAAIFFLKHSYFVELATVAIATFIFSYIATRQESLSQMGTLGAVTTVIIMMGSPPTLKLAGMRFLEISVGILIASFVSQFIFPIHARTHLRRSQAAALAQIRGLYTTVISTRFSHPRNETFHELDENITLSLLKQRQLAKDSAAELMGKRFDPEHFARSLYCEREILRAINFMDMALSRISGIETIVTTENPLKIFNAAVTQAFDVLIRVLKTNHLANAHIHLPDISLMAKALHQYPELMVEGQHVYLDGFVFSAEVLTTHIRELAQLYQIPVSGAPLPA